MSREGHHDWETKQLSAEAAAAVAWETGNFVESMIEDRRMPQRPAYLSRKALVVRRRLSFEAGDECVVTATASSYRAVGMQSPEEVAIMKTCPLFLDSAWADVFLPHYRGQD